MKGPKSEIRKMQVHEVRKSADYRIVKRNQWDHAAVYMININPLRDFYASLKKMDWKKNRRYHLRWRRCGNLRRNQRKGKECRKTGYYRVYRF